MDEFAWWRRWIRMLGWYITFLSCCSVLVAAVAYIQSYLVKWDGGAPRSGLWCWWQVEIWWRHVSCVHNLIIMVADWLAISLQCELQKKTNTALSIRTYDKYLPYGILQPMVSTKKHNDTVIGIMSPSEVPKEEDENPTPNFNEGIIYAAVLPWNIPFPLPTHPLQPAPWQDERTIDSSFHSGSANFTSATALQGGRKGPPQNSWLDQLGAMDMLASPHP